jgi:hypothetical protein
MYASLLSADCLCPSFGFGNEREMSRGAPAFILVFYVAVGWLCPYRACAYGYAGDTAPISDKGSVWQQDPGDPNNYIVVCSEVMPNYDITCIACDDFQPSTDTVINAISWYGGYWNGTVTPFSDCHILFYNNSESLPQQNPVYDQTFAYSATAETLWNSSGSAYFYSYSLPSIPPFYASGGTTYWVSAYVTMDFPPQWGLYYSSSNWGSSICQQSQYFFGDTGWHLYSGGSCDWAFQLFANATLETRSLGVLKALYH